MKSIQQIKSIAIQKSIYHSKLDFVFASFLPICLYLAVDASHSIVWYIFSAILMVALLNKPKLLLFSLAMCLSVYLSWWVNHQPTYSSYLSGEFVVKKKLSSGFIIKYNGANIYVHSKRPIDIYDVVKVSGKIEQPTNTGTFDFVTYLKTMKIGNEISWPKYIRVISHSHDLRTKALQYLSSGPESYQKINPLLLLGKKTNLSKPIYEMAFELSVVHLFVISGFHISLVYLILNKILVTCKMNEKYAGVFSLLPILVYIFLLNFPLSATRASLLIILSVGNKTFLNSKFKSLDIIAVVMLGMFLYNPDSVYSLSFIFTFIATFVVIYVNGIEFKQEWHKWAAIAIGAYLSNMFISMRTNGWISIFGFVFGVVLAPVFVVVYSISLFLFPAKSLLGWIDEIFLFILNAFHSLNIKVDVPQFNLYILQSIYLIPISYLIINKIWNLYMVTNPT